MRAGRPARAAVPSQPAAREFPANYFTALIRLHDWPPLFCAQFQRTREVEQSEISRINREKRVALGDTGTILGLTQRADELIHKRMLSKRAIR